MFRHNYLSTAAVLTFFTYLVGSVSAETCAGFIPKTKAAPYCILRRKNNCVPNYGDVGCGMGVAIYYYDNCETELVACCAPCIDEQKNETMKIIMTGCTALYCQYGKLSLGAHYVAENKCQYIATEWSPCHSDILRRKRVDTLALGQLGSCPVHNTIEKVCDFTEVDLSKPSEPVVLPNDIPPEQTREASTALPPSNRVAASVSTESEFEHETSEKDESSHCRYTSDGKNWTSCDPDTKSRTRSKILVAGSSANCKKFIVEEKPCFRPNGKERCFFSDWSKWSACFGSMRYKYREILYGDPGHCKHQQVKAKFCNIPEETKKRRRRRRRERDTTVESAKTERKQLFK